MTGNFGNWDDQTLDLAIQAYTQGVEDPQFEELHGLAAHHDLECFEQTLAAIHWSHAARMIDPPSDVMERLEREAALWLDPSPESPTLRAVGPRRPIPWFAIAGWALAASLCLLLFARTFRGPAPFHAVKQMQALMAEAPDLQRIDWSVSEDPLAAGASGEVVWSDSRQEGYMVFRGLEPNDPRAAQFQLWIFDPSREGWDKTPVDGGVFDVAAGEQVVIPIHAKLPVHGVSLFAVTLEKPGGVVVSKREHLLLTAPVS